MWTLCRRRNGVDKRGGDIKRESVIMPSSIKAVTQGDDTLVTSTVNVLDPSNGGRLDRARFPFSD